LFQTKVSLTYRNWPSFLQNWEVI